MSLARPRPVDVVVGVKMVEQAWAGTCICAPIIAMVWMPATTTTQFLASHVSLFMYVKECQTSLILQSESQSAIMQFDNTDRVRNLRSPSPNQASGDTQGSIHGITSSVFGLAEVALGYSQPLPTKP